MSSEAIATSSGRAADEIIARLERIPFSRFHWRLFFYLSGASIFDAFDALTIAVALTVVFMEFHISFVNAGLLISAAYVGQLVESAWTYRHPPRIGKAKLYRLEAAPPRAREVAWKAQTRLTARYRALTRRGKKTTVVSTAIARELVGFMWSMAREAQTA